jgi:hypothetical protein
MADTAAHLVDRVLPGVPIRQWVLTLPYALRYRCAYDMALTNEVLRAFVRLAQNALDEVPMLATEGRAVLAAAGDVAGGLDDSGHRMTAETIFFPRNGVPGYNPHKLDGYLGNDRAHHVSQ